MAPTYAQLQAEPWWDREIYTDAMRWLAGALTAHYGTPAVNAGCKGDNQHLNGGHRSQEWILNSRYCTSRSYAIEGGLSGEQARYLSALDYTPASREVMLAISQRLDTATRAGHLEEVVEWFGNTDGDQRVDGWNNIKNAVATSDSSHLWHLHLRVGRRWANDMGVARRIFATLTATAYDDGGDDVGTLDGVQGEQLNNLEKLRQALTNGDSHVRGVFVWTGPGEGGKHVDQPIGLYDTIAAKVKPATVSLSAEDRAAIITDLENRLGDVVELRLRRVLGGVDGASPPDA